MNKGLLRVARYLGSQGLYKEAAQIKKLAGTFDGGKSCDESAREIILKHLKQEFPEVLKIDNSGSFSEESLKILNANPDYLDDILDFALEEWHDAAGQSYNESLTNLGLRDWEE